MGLIAGAAGGWLASILKLAGTGFGITIIPGTLLYLNGQIVKYLIMVIGTTALAFVLTYMFGYEDKDEKVVAEVSPLVEETDDNPTITQTSQLRAETIVSPLDGQVIALDTVSDPVFFIRYYGRWPCY